jgi:hypothetical protein
MRLARPVYTLVLSPVLLTLAACGGSTEPGDVGDGSDFEGLYRLIVDVTEASGVCAGEELEPHDTLSALITQDGAVVAATAQWTDESGAVTLFGQRNGSQISFGGSYAEDGGTTTSQYTLNIAPGSLNGGEAWSWTGAGGTCLFGASIVTGEPL